MNSKSTKNFKVLAMILLTSTLLIVAASASIPNAKAATTTNLILYTTLGMNTVSANGTAMTPGSTGNALTTGDTYTFTATASSGYKLIGWAYADSSGPTGSTSATFSKVISAACSLEAIFVPTTNTTATSSGSGASTLTLFATAGGTTSPSGTLAGASISATIGHTTTITETAGTGYTFLCWVVQCSQSNYYTSSTLNYTPISSGAAIEALWIPTGSGITLSSTSATPTPKVSEFSSAIVAVLALALVASAFGTYAFTKKVRK
jgi:hypothetical protein